MYSLGASEEIFRFMDAQDDVVGRVREFVEEIEAFGEEVGTPAEEVA